MSFEMDDCLMVLKGTQDGGLLAPEDLKLLESVANTRGENFSKELRTRWESIVNAVKNSTYLDSKIWFCGIPNLTRKASGYVYWKETCIEHYTFNDREAELSSAVRLAACCMKIESEGGVVDYESISAMWTKLDYAQELDTPKYVVSWSVSNGTAGQMEVASLPTGVKTAEQYRSLSVLHRDAFARKNAMDPISGSVRSMSVCSQEQLQSLREGIRRDIDWLKNFSQRSSMQQVCTMVEEKFSSAIGSKIDASSLPTEEAIAEVMLGQFLPVLDGAPVEIPRQR